MGRVEDVETVLTAELVVDGSEPRCPVISPDGRWVVYRIAPVGQVGERPVGELWIGAVDGSIAPRKLTEGAAAGRSPQWTWDSEAVFFLSNAKGGEAQLHRIRRSGGAMEVLTAWTSGISDYLPLLDPGLVALIAPDEPSERDQLREQERDDAWVWSESIRPDRLRLLDLRTGGIRTLAGLGDRHVIEAVQRPDGGPLAVVTWSGPEVDPGSFSPELHLVDPESGTSRSLGPTELETSSLAWWNAEGDWHLAYLATTPGGVLGGAAVFDIAVSDSGSAIESRNLTVGMTACPAALVQVGSGVPLVLVADGLDTAVHRLSPDGTELAEVARVQGELESLTASWSGDVVAALASTRYEPLEVYAGPPEQPLTRISDTRPEYRGIQWGIQERLSYRAVDGLALEGLLILPAGKSRQDGPFPLVTIVHGGPYWRHADQLQLQLGEYPSGQWLAAAGYAVFLPNPRGSRGYGHDFAVTVSVAVGVDEWTDITAGIDMLIAEGVAAPDRLGIGGWSHGGYIAAWAVGQSDRFKAAVMGAGISDWGMLAAAGEFGQFEAALSGSTGWEGVGPHPHDRLSPISFASKVNTPVLILHGGNDTNVPLSQGEFFHRALRHFGVEHEFVVYPREGHGIRERNHQLDILRRTRAWFDRWLKTPAEEGKA